MSKTFEKDGEVYIISDDVENLDTENLIDKSLLQKLIEINGPILKSESSKIENLEPVTKNILNSEKKINMFFSLQCTNENFNIYSNLIGFSAAEQISYTVLLSATDYTKIAILLLMQKEIFIKNISFSCGSFNKQVEESSIMKVNNIFCRINENNEYLCDFSIIKNNET